MDALAALEGVVNTVENVVNGKTAVDDLLCTDSADDHSHHLQPGTEACWLCFCIELVPCLCGDAALYASYAKTQCFFCVRHAYHYSQCQS